MINDWKVLARQTALMVVPVALVLLKVPAPIAALMSQPAVEILTTVLIAAGLWVVGWVIRIGQRRETPQSKIEQVAELPQVRMISLRDEDMAASIPNGKVIP